MLGRLVGPMLQLLLASGLTCGPALARDTGADLQGFWEHRNMTPLERPDGSASKLSTYRDGFRILKTMLKLFSTERPIAFYGIVAGVLAAASVALGLPLLFTYLETGLVPRIPTAILAASSMTLGVLSLLAGVILHAVTKGRREIKALAYLRIPSPSSLFRSRVDA